MITPLSEGAARRFVSDRAVIFSTKSTRTEWSPGVSTRHLAVFRTSILSERRVQAVTSNRLHLVALVRSNRSCMEDMEQQETTGLGSTYKLSLRVHVLSSMICDEGCLRHRSYAACCNREHEQVDNVSNARIDETRD